MNFKFSLGDWNYFIAEESQMKKKEWILGKKKPKKTQTSSS